MAIVTRANKAGSGTPNYVPDTTILSDEVNLDFNTLYDDYDGNITDANIANGANIDGAKLANNSIPGAKIVSGTITDLQISTTADIQRIKLQQPNFSSSSIMTSLGPINSGLETTLWTLSFTHTGGPINFVPGGTVTVEGGVSHPRLFTFRWKQNGVLLPSGTATLAFDPIVGAGGSGDAVVIPIPGFMTQVAPATDVFTLTGELATGGGDWFTTATPGSIFAVEMR